LLASDVILNSYFLFCAVIFAVLIATGGQLGTQGRYWLPFMLPSVLCATRYAPQLFRRRRTRRLFATALGAGLLAYCVVGTFAGFAALETRFYRPPAVLHEVEYLARITRIGPYNLYLPQTEPLGLRRNERIPIDGWAIDSRTGKPALSVEVVIDDGVRSPTRFGSARPDVVDRLNDDDFLNSGFAATLDTARLGWGEHRISLAVGERDRLARHPSRAVVRVFVGER
jgi:hypothetical protein